MTKVIVTVAAHSVECDADAPLAEVAETAMRLYRQTTLPARSIGVGFDSAGLTTDRAESYVEPEPSREGIAG